MDKVVLDWQRFGSFRKARETFRQRPCLYVLVDHDGQILRIGESDDLWRRYNGGTGWMVDAALHASGKVVLVAGAPVDPKERRRAEATLVFGCKPEYCVQNKWVGPSAPAEIEHTGDVPAGFR